MSKTSGILMPRKGEIFTMLSPMAGVTDRSFRTICKEMGADMTVTEMISAKAVTYGNKKTIALCPADDTEHPIALQIFGSEPDVMAQASSILSDRIPFDILDINMGCPMPKIVNNGEGSALMKDPALAGRIVAAIRRSIDKPVSVKIRAGFDKSHINAVETALALQEAGASYIVIHGRTADQYYEGRADWDIIASVKEALDIPVIGNGDVTDIDSARKMMAHTGCDGVAIGRAARGNPWIFREISTGTGYRPTTDEKISMMRRHLDMCIEEKGEYTGIREMRKHIGWYTQGMKGSASLRRSINEAESADGMIKLIESLNLTKHSE